ncbi:hypothetical protein FJ492_00450 [Mesorhizobium sp. B2-5-4]|uniref:hypothetical protein n=1 Tax=Mesorhizobium sp. B2-5-4 TaxID=2589926 RepID=UPI00112B98AB|nr:hypothetical protein [Mesorhizobium sp. B2-5-4]TPK49602.1 hypothetical protein FJ492_00450 [Mesorhizobium sp. B2-5-4]
MKSANEAIFVSLDDFCRLRGLALANAGQARWIATERSDRDFLISAKIEEILSFSPRRKIASVSKGVETYIFCVGFDFDEEIFGLQEQDVLGGHLTVALAELSPLPLRSPDEIRQIVEYADKRNSGYGGHDPELVGALFPLVRLLRFSRPVPTWSTFFSIALSETQLAGTWIEKGLVDDLKMVVDLDDDRIPYKVLCRSIFDVDPSSFFLALYRCIEALFAYSSASDLSKKLNLTQNWGAIASALEDTLGWHPREDGSLERLLRLALKVDLDRITTLIGRVKIGESESPLCAARSIYWLRNSIVHFRPLQHEVALSRFDWNGICSTMAAIVLDIYAALK